MNQKDFHRGCLQGRTAMDIIDHPILGKLTPKENVTIYFEGKKISVRDGLTVAAALIANGVYAFGHSRNLSQARGLYCANGRCQSCLLTIDGVERVRSCNILVRDGMIVKQSTRDPDLRGGSNDN
jgi:sarcosine oxidase subunit alpha